MAHIEWLIVALLINNYRPGRVKKRILSDIAQLDDDDRKLQEEYVAVVNQIGEILRSLEESLPDI